MWTLKNLIKFSSETHAQINGKWVPARPVKEPWLWRLKDAIKVLKGKADSFVWPEDQ